MTNTQRKIWSSFIYSPSHLVYFVLKKCIYWSFQSAEVYTMVKKDLDEIGTAVKSEASHVFSTTSTVIGKTFKVTFRY